MRILRPEYWSVKFILIKKKKQCCEQCGESEIKDGNIITKQVIAHGGFISNFLILAYKSISSF